MADDPLVMPQDEFELTRWVFELAGGPAFPANAATACRIAARMNAGGNGEVFTRLAEALSESVAPAEASPSLGAGQASATADEQSGGPSTADLREAAAALERVREMAGKWIPLGGADALLGRRLLAVIAVGDTGDAADRVQSLTVMAESWLMPGAPLFYPAAGQCVLDALRGGVTEEEASWRQRAERAEAGNARLRAAIADLCAEGRPAVAVDRIEAILRSGRTPAISATCTGPDCGTLFADSETGEYEFATRERMERLLHADGWTVLCPACQEEGS